MGLVSRRVRCLGLLALVVVTAGCSDAPTTTSTPSPETSTTTVTAEPSASTTSTTSATSTTSPPESTTTTPEVSIGTFTVPIGTVVVEDGDVFVVHNDGDLWLHPGLLGGSGAAPLRLADMGDPRVPVTEGDGPNMVAKVVGEVGGAVYFSDCCEPVAGNVMAATGAEGVARVTYGYEIALSPDRSRLATLNSFGLQLLDLTTSTFAYRELNLGQSYINPWDLVWSTDGSQLVMLYFDEQGFALLPFSASASLTPGPFRRIDEAFDPMQPLGAQFAGHGPNGEIALVFYSTDRTRIAYFDPSKLLELPDLERELPADVTSVRLAADGVGLLWIDQETLWHLPSAGVARSLGSGFTAAWFAT